MNTPIPCPKKYVLTGASVPAPMKIFCEEAEFFPAISVFCDAMNHAFGVEFTEEHGGMVLKRSSGPEDYSISVGETVTLSAAGAEGMNHAFATLIQLYLEAPDGLRLPCCEVSDRCDSEWRGLCLDLARCWHPAEFLFHAADLCWLYKINRLQLHLTDAEGVRFPFRAFPAVVSEEHYTSAELAALNRYCAERGITVVPEVDAPGHCRPFNKAYPEVFGSLDNLLCAEEKTFDGLRTVYAELADAFPDSPWIHVGGDEAAHELWNDCPGCQAYCREHGIEGDQALYGHFVMRLTEIVRSLGRKPLVWEGFHADCDGMISKDVKVFGWESLYQLPPDLIRGGFRVLNASWKPLYVVTHTRFWSPEDILRWEKNKWENWWEESPAAHAPIYLDPADPIDGGQLCSWGDTMRPKKAYAPVPEMVEEEYGLIRFRLPALAEKLWTCYHRPDPAAFVWNLHKADRLFLRLSR